MDMIPFAPLPLPALKKISKKFIGFGDLITDKFPFIENDLSQTNIELNAREYGSIIFLLSSFYFVFILFISLLMLPKFVITKKIIMGIIIPDYLFVSIVVSLLFAVLIFVQLIAYPKIKIKKRVRDIDANLVFALRTMLVQIKSGVSLFDSLSMIATSKRFGQLGEEIKIAVDKINTGSLEHVALEEIARKNPSNYLRKALWQILNGMKAGADITDVLGGSVSTIIREQQIEIKKYGSSLRMFSLMYLMIGVILPALGITFLIVIGSFPKIEISELMFWGLLGGLIVTEFMFIGIIKSKRPGLMGD